MEKIIETDRLILTRLTDTTLEGRDVQWFHENWSDTDATAWRYVRLLLSPQCIWLPYRLDTLPSPISILFRIYSSFSSAVLDDGDLCDLLHALRYLFFSGILFTFATITIQVSSIPANICIHTE